MKKFKGIALIKLILIILIILISVITIFTIIFSTDVSQSVEIFFQTITHQIDISAEIEENEKLLGITDVKGEGLIINILDGKDMIHQEDMIIMIDELKNCGSQAISINNQRITNSTYLYCDGSVILLDGEKIGNPFQIKAIGDTETLYGAITRNKGYIRVLEKDEIEIDIQKSDNVEIAKTNNEKLLNYGKGKTKIGKLRTLKQLVGKADMRGKGIEIIIHENKAKLTALSFIQLINDLNSGGALAISINDNRVVANTDAMDISNTYVLLNSIPITAPYSIKVIGNSEDLETALYYANSQYSKIKSKGNDMTIYEYNILQVDKYIHKKDKDKMIIDYLK